MGKWIRPFPHFSGNVDKRSGTSNKLRTCHPLSVRIRSLLPNLTNQKSPEGGFLFDIEHVLWYHRSMTKYVDPKTVKLADVVKMATHFVYILECKDGTYYTGYTTNVTERVAKHNSGKGSKYTRGRLPVKLHTFWSFNSKSTAMSIEYKIKQLSHIDKRELKGCQILL